MSWVKLDDGFAEHPKIAKVGPIGAWLQIQALCYCNPNLTDGFVPMAVAYTFVPRTRSYPAKQCVTLIVDAGLWERVPGGYRIHDYERYQPSKAEVLRTRQQHVARQQKYLERKRSDRVIDAVIDASPVPVPEEQKKKKLAIARKEKAHDSEFQELDYDLGIARRHGCTAPEKALEAFRAHAIAHNRKLANWKGGWWQWCVHHDSRCPCGARTPQPGRAHVPDAAATRRMLKEKGL
jgi:hypothetical protein